MFTELMLRQQPALIRAFTGIPAEAFWEMLEKMEARFSDYETGRHTRDGRQRRSGAGGSSSNPWRCGRWPCWPICGSISRNRRLR